MHFIDTHAHLYASEFEADRAEMLARAREAGIIHCFLPNVDRDSIQPMLDLEAAFPQQCTALMGLHPCSVEGDYRQDLAWVESWLGQRHFYAVGEIGLDYYWSKEHIREQQEAFSLQCRWAAELDLPVVIHARESLDDLIRLVFDLKYQYPQLRGVFHCFTGDVAQAQRIIEAGFMLGIGGVLTYKNSTLGQVLADIDLKHLVLETDAPYLPPVPHRGKRNESAYIRLVAEHLALKKGLDLETVAAQTTANAQRLFRWESVLVG